MVPSYEFYLKLHLLIYPVFFSYFQDVFPDKATERKILSLAIKCPSDGCEWSGELRQKEVVKHIAIYDLIYCQPKLVKPLSN